MNSIAMVADSFITVPKLPVIVKLPLPFDNMDSMNRMSPPTLVQANPVTIPATSLDSDKSRSILGGPRISSTSCVEVTTL